VILTIDLFLYSLTIVKLLQKVKQMNIENWENVRGPRPWEENFGAAQQRSG